MNHLKNIPHRRPKNPASRQAFERLEESLAENTSVSNTEKLQLLGRHMFGDLWHDPEPNGSEIVPK